MRGKTLQTISSLRKDGRLAEAIDLTDRMLEESPDDGRVWEERGLLFDRLCQFDKSRDALERATTLVTLRSQAQCVLAERYAAMGLRSLAEEMLEALVRNVDAQPALLLRVAAALHSLGRTASAVEACRRSASRDPHAAAPLYAMGYYVERGGWPRALAENMLRKALEFEPDCAKYRVGLVAFLHRHERFCAAYAVAVAMTLESLAGLHCACCVVRLLDVFDRHEDEERAMACRRRLMTLFDGMA